MPDPADRRSRPWRVGAGIVLALVVLAVVSCAKVEDQPGSASTERQVTYVAVKLIPAGKTIRAAKADGSMQLEEVPGDVLGGEGIDDPNPIECLVAGRALPAGTLLRRNLFVQPSELGLERGLTDGTTVDDEC